MQKLVSTDLAAHQPFYKILEDTLSKLETEEKEAHKILDESDESDQLGKPDKKALTDIKGSIAVCVTRETPIMPARAEAPDQKCYVFKRDSLRYAVKLWNTLSKLFPECDVKIIVDHANQKHSTFDDDYEQVISVIPLTSLITLNTQQDDSDLQAAHGSTEWVIYTEDNVRQILEASHAIVHAPSKLISPLIENKKEDAKKQKEMEERGVTFITPGLPIEKKFSNPEFNHHNERKGIFSGPILTDSDIFDNKTLRNTFCTNTDNSQKIDPDKPFYFISSENPLAAAYYSLVTGFVEAGKNDEITVVLYKGRTSISYSRKICAQCRFYLN